MAKGIRFYETGGPEVLPLGVARRSATPARARCGSATSPSA